MNTEVKKPSPPKSVLIAISNSSQCKDISEILAADHDVTSPRIVHDGDEAWNALKDGGFDFVILEWKLPKTSGLILFNRLKQDSRYQSVPVLVVSELIQKENFILLKDYPLTGLVDGEFSIKTFSLKFDLLLNERVWYQTNSDALNDIAESLKPNPTKAKSDLDALIKSAPNALPILNLAAKKLIEIEHYDDAERVLNDALKLDDQNTTSIMELAKVLHRRGKHNEALNLIKNHKFSMKNVERLLLIGEINLAEKNPEEARAIFLNALEIDSEQATAKSGILVADNMQKFLVTNDANTLPSSFASILNLVAISLVKSGQQEEGILQYKAALAFMHDSLSQSKLMYNLGLGYLRWSKKAEAIDWFQQSAKAGGTEFAKGREYLKRLSASSSHPQNPSDTIDLDKTALEIEVSAKPGTDRKPE